MNYDLMSLEELRALVQKHSDLYYLGIESPESIPDSEFDKMYRVLEMREQFFPPEQRMTNRVNQPQKNTRGLVIHATPMQSIKTVIDTSEEGFKAFDASNRRQLGINDDVPIQYVCEPKYDGLGLNLKYHMGKLMDIVVRGDGNMGESVFGAASKYNREMMPLQLKEPFTGEIRGEGLMGKMTFIEYNQFLERSNQKPKKNPRNAVAGVTRAKTKEPFLEGKLLFFPYSIPGSDKRFSTQIEALMWLKDQGFQFLESLQPAMMTYCPSDTESPYVYYQDVVRDMIGVEMDGVVYKVNSVELQNRLGFREREPRWAIAQKFAPEEVTTQLLGFETTVGRTGVLTPVAKLNPVHVCGVTVSSCIMDNFFQTRRLDLRVGDFVILKRSGDTIPKITGRIPNRPSYVKNITRPGTCPFCDGPIVRAKGYKESYCININCRGRELETLTYFVGRECLDIQGLGEKTVEELYSQGLVKYPHQFFDLKLEHLSPILGEKLATKVFYNIKGATSCFDWKLIQALGIPGVGVVTAKEICQKYRLFGENGLARQVCSLDQAFGEYPQLKHYFSFPGKWDQFILLLTHFRNSVIVTTGTLAKVGKGQMVMTGSFEFKRKEKAVELEALGWKVSENVRNTTICVVAGDNPTTHKVAKAIELNIPVLSWDEFKEKYPW